MKFEILKRSHLKRNIMIGILIVAVISAVVLNFTKAKYKATQSIPLVSGTINYSLADLNIVAIYIDGNEVDTLDESVMYTLDAEKSVCTYKDGSTIENLVLNHDSETRSFSIAPFTTKGTKCTLYFNSIPGITTATLSYNATTINNTSNPNLIIDSEYESITYSITSGSAYASINENTGVVTGKSNGTAVVEASIIDKKGNNIIVTSSVQIGSISNTNRYVWGKYNLSQNINEEYLGTSISGNQIKTWIDGAKGSGSNSWSPTEGGYFSIEFETPLYFALSEKYVKSSNNTFKLSNIVKTNVLSGQYKNSFSFSQTGIVYNEGNSKQFYAAVSLNPITENTEFQYIFPLSFVSGGTISLVAYINVPNSYDSNYYDSNHPQNAIYVLPEVRSYNQNQPTYRYSLMTSKGSLIENVSGTSNSTYPTDAISGSYWYTYQGNDIIDPNGVTLSLSGTNVTATVNTRSNTYGGTISYQYEYSINGGATWTTVATTSSTSYNMAIPSNAKSIIVRVKAQDNYGFTSNTYLYSNGISIVK